MEKSKDLNSKEKDYNEALDYLGITDEEVKANARTVLTKEGKDERLLKINNIPLEYKATLEGKKKDEETGEYIQVGKAMASSNFIRISFSILNSFGDQSNIVSKKQIETFFIQFRDAFNKINAMILRDRAIDEKNTSGIIKMFKDKMLNLGEIISGNDKRIIEMMLQGRANEDIAKEELLK